MRRRYSMRLDLFQCFLLVAFGSLIILLAACAETQKLSLNIPEGDATSTLLEFARQANVEIVFDAQSIDGVKTSSIVGDFDPQSALRIMLKGTPLKVYFDASSGAYAIIRNKDSQASVRIHFFKNDGSYALWRHQQVNLKNTIKLNFL